MSLPGILLTPMDPDAFAGERTPENIRRSAAVFQTPARSAASVLSTVQNMRRAAGAVTGTMNRNVPRTTAPTPANDRGAQ